ncbi:MAG: FAD-dependent monooxygenase, partial [Phenylobacterium sp.]|nr:FAD-dependent monooxygenase [Phenylobacterium sp.]
MDDASRPADPILDFDPDALRERYRQEREKRLRSDGEAQYIELAGEFARYAEDDPYADPSFTRAPLSDEVEVAIIGGGFSGLLAGARLREAGVEDIRIIEADADVLQKQRRITAEGHEVGVGLKDAGIGRHTVDLLARQLQALDARAVAELHALLRRQRRQVLRELET